MKHSGFVAVIVVALLLQAGSYGIAGADVGRSGAVFAATEETGNETTTAVETTERSAFPDSVYAGSDSASESESQPGSSPSSTSTSDVDTDSDPDSDSDSDSDGEPTDTDTATDTATDAGSSNASPSVTSSPVSSDSPDSSSSESSTTDSPDSSSSSASSASTPSADDTAPPSGSEASDSSPSDDDADSDSDTDSNSNSDADTDSTSDSGASAGTDADSDTGSSPATTAAAGTTQPSAPNTGASSSGGTAAASAGAAGSAGSAAGGSAGSAGAGGSAASADIPGGPGGAGGDTAGSGTGSSGVPAGSGTAIPTGDAGPGAAGGSDGSAVSADTPGGSGVSAGGAQGGSAQGAAAQTGSAPVSSDAEFEVISSSLDASAGASGTLEVTLENTGEDAEDAVVTLQSQSSALTFGGAGSTSLFVGEWDEGDTETIEADVTVAPGSEGGTYPVQATVSYENPDGEQVQSAPLTFGVSPGDEQDFSLGGVDSSLSAGSDGTISGTITNEGPETAESAVLLFGGNTSDVTPRQSEVVLGDLDSGESVDFEYPVSVRPGAPAGERQIPFVVQYQNADGETIRSSTLNAQVTIDQRADDLEVTDVDSDLEPGEQGTVEVTLENTGEDAEDAVVNLQSLSGAVLFGEAPNASKFVGELDDGETVTIELSATAAQGIATGEYPVQASLSYTDPDNEPARAGPVVFGVGVDESTDDFEIASTSSTVPIGEEGTVSVTLNNTGEDVTEATVSLASLSPDLVVGPTGNATRFVGDWSVGEQRTVEYQVRASNDTERRSYPFRVSASYTDADGDSARSDSRTFGVTPLREQAFTLENVSGNLSVGDEGTVTGTVVNEGPGVARNAVITLSVDNANVNPQETEFALGTLEAGESANFSFPIEVTDSAESGVRQLSFAVEYDNAAGDSRESDTISAQVDVAPQRDEFDIVRRNATLDVGATETVRLEVINNRDSTVRNINARAFVDSPLSLADDEAFITELEPGESANITFEVSSTGSASAGTYPLSLDFQYDTPDGESKLSETYEVPIEVRDPESSGLLSLGGGGLPILPLLLVVVIVIVAALVVRRRTDGGGGDGESSGGAGGGGNDGDE